MLQAPNSAERLIGWVRDARGRTSDLVADLSDEQMIGPKLPTINPLLWEIGHAAWFQERWVLQHCGNLPPIRADLDALYDSIAIEHDVRWDLPLLPREEVMRYLETVRDRTCDLLAGSKITSELDNFVRLSVFHEDMHTEAFTYTRQTLGYSRPMFSEHPLSFSEKTQNASVRGEIREDVNSSSDVSVSGGSFVLGSNPSSTFVFDNEQWGHSINLESYAISQTAVSQGEFAEFVEDGGYNRRDLWCDEGWGWRTLVGAVRPVYWRREANGDWHRRDFDQWIALEPRRAMMHVNWYEANAFCRWAGRRLPSEAEWEYAAAASFATDSEADFEKRKYPWGGQCPTRDRANLDWAAMGAVDVANCPAGDSPAGCRQMIGNVWEWTDTTFQPYPGFAPGPYREYSLTSFGHCKALRGGCWTTRGRMIKNTYRNYYAPDRRDVWAGFRTCAIDGR